MTLEADQIVARRKLKRQVSFWRAGAVVLAVIALIVLVGSSNGDGALSKFSDHVARVRIEGFISGDEKTLKLFKDIAESHNGTI